MTARGRRHRTDPPFAARGHRQDLPRVRALDGVHFDVRPGEVHALLGENGAGKSTLMKVLAGNHQPNEGTDLYRRRESDGQPARGQAKGVVLIHQELSLCPSCRWPRTSSGRAAAQELRPGRLGTLRAAPARS